MAARGSEEKIAIQKKILEVFEGSFMEDDKIIRIPMNDVEIKISLTCAKDVLGGAAVQPSSSQDAPSAIEPPTEAEVTEVKNLIKTLGL